MHVVLDSELDNLGSANRKASFDFGMFTASFSFASAALITLLTAEIPNPYTFACFVVCCGVSVLATIVFGFLAKRDDVNAQKQIQMIREANKTKITVGK